MIPAKMRKNTNTLRNTSEPCMVPYFGCAACVKPEFLLFELGAVLGNSLGSVLLPLLALLGAWQRKKEDPAPENGKTPAEGEPSDEG